MAPNGPRLSCGASASGRKTPPCGTSGLGHQPTLPLKTGPVSFKRLLGSRGMGSLSDPPLFIVKQ